MATGGRSDVDAEVFYFDKVATTSNYIDKGAYGEVYGPFTWNSGQCALKRIRLPAGKPGDEIKLQVDDKKSIWTSLKHKHLIDIRNVVVGANTLYIVMEYAGGGSLRTLLDDSDALIHCKKHFSNWATQIAEGMRVLHGKNIVHRDLKSNNIMLMDPFDFANPDKQMTLKIIDFDEAREIDHTTTMSMRGTLAYTAPEVIETERFSKASDVWSFGVVVWEMLTGERPHKDVNEAAIMQGTLIDQLSLSIPESTPEAYRELLCECFRKDKYRRPSFQDVIGVLKKENATIGFSIDQRGGRYESDSALIQTITTNSPANENKQIVGLTVLWKELFVIREQSSEVDVYDLTNFSFSRRWNLKELIHPQDIVSCRTKRCIYILNYKGVGLSTEILRVNSNGNLIKNWSTGNDCGKSLSVTHESNIILTVFISHKLNEYSPDGKLIREINISSVRYPNHATKLTSGNFVISYGDVHDELHRICIIGADGKLQKTFEEYRGSNIGQLSRPVSVGGEGLFMVADVCRPNQRVLLLDSALEPRREIRLNEVQNDLRHPTSILLDELNDRLLVVDHESNNHRILIFDFL